jgi:cytosine/adenosine deaminase-related metal-dependent hydrolase
MDDHQREIPEGGLFIRDGIIQQVGLTADLPQTADEVLDLKGHIVLPGLVNTHHHFYQTLTRAVPAAQDANLFNWLKTLYPIWARLTPDDIFISTQTALAELALSGCTTASDHLYLFPNGSKLDDEIAAASEIGVRLQASRGSMSLGESKGGLPPD